MANGLCPAGIHEIYGAEFEELYIRYENQGHARSISVQNL